VQPGINVEGHGDYNLTSGSFGARVGAWLGDKAQGLITSLTGSGDYSVNKNSITQGPIEFQAAKNGFRVPHTEYVCDVISAGGSFACSRYAINPLNATLFPWLPNIAQNFEEYRIEGLVAMFKTNSGDAVSSTNAALGSVIIATQYNATDEPFVDKLAMEQYMFATSTVPSCSMMHPVECAKGTSPVDVLFVAGPDSMTIDPRFSTFGIINVATVGQQAASNLGEFWVSYDIVFTKPRLLNGLPSNPTLFSCWWYSGAVDIPTNNPWSKFAPTISDSSTFIANTYYTSNGGAYPNEWNIEFPSTVSGNFCILFSLGLTGGATWRSPSAGIINYGASSFDNGCTKLNYLAHNPGPSYSSGVSPLVGGADDFTSVIFVNITHNSSGLPPRAKILNSLTDNVASFNIVILPVIGYAQSGGSPPSMALADRCRTGPMNLVTATNQIRALQQEVQRLVTLTTTLSLAQDNQIVTTPDYVYLPSNTPSSTATIMMNRKGK